ncbi:phospholipase A2 inhibitor subunit gamma B-like isoform X1 [Polyodon spathula]|uniref:phospholipase A2 inhibitor subunit gamma B-like isoform X1 n=1 Tax=Polyodon spathula TaxID=7913 RepID=UPI001B7E5477|nr:phospholipase A2 inhibitor subunit gamma B-like isoform X1 [Polyodon spathula]
MNPFSAVVIAGIFFGNAYSLSCNSCSGTNSCTPIAVRCSSSPSVCLTVSTSAIGFEQFGFGTSKFTNMCGPKLQYCNETLSADFSELSITVNVECCDSDNCNTGVYTVPADNTLNGIQCPLCVRIGTAQCDSAETVQCRGKQDQCFTINGTVTPGSSDKVTLQGCSTRTTCDKSYLFTLIPKLSNLEVSCIDKSGFCPQGINMFVIAAAAVLALRVAFN